MERAQYTVTIDVVNTGITNTQLRLKQGDSGTPLHIKVENNGNPYYDPAVIPQVYFRRPDRTTVLGTAHPGSDNEYLYVFKGSELEVSGNILADVKFKHANGRESTSTFKFECVMDTIGQSIETSKIIWNDVVEVIKKAERMLAGSEEVIADMTEQAELASNSANAAAASEERVEENATSATESAEAAIKAAASAKQASEEAEKHASNCNDKVTIAEAAADNASESAQNALGYMEAALGSSEAALASETNAKYYAEQAIDISERISGVLRPKGTITYNELDLDAADESDMYNISDSFITTDLFKEGAGHVIPSGSNVYKTSDGLWDVLAGSPVSGIKGSNEEIYRTGNVNITSENIGLGNVDNTSDMDKPVSRAANKRFETLGSTDESIIQVINQAAKSWMIPEDYTVDIYGINNPTSETVGNVYLDVKTGQIFMVVNNEWTVMHSCTSVEEEINTIKSNLEWKFVGTVTGTSIINLPDNYQEIYVEAGVGIHYVSFNIPKVALNSGVKRFHSGSYTSSGKYFGVLIDIDSSLSSANIIEFKYNQTDYISQATLGVWYR